MRAHHCYIFIQINFYDAFFVYNIIQTSCCFFFWKKVATFMSKVAHKFCWLLVLIETPGHDKDVSLPDFLFEARGRLFSGYHKGQNNLSHLSKIHSFIISFCLNVVNPPIPESMLFIVKERLEGLKYNFGFRGRGWGNTGGGDRYVHCSKRGHFKEES